MAHPKYGQNEWHELLFCPRCCDAVPVFIRKTITSDSIHGTQESRTLYCRKCEFYNHKDGSFLKELKES